eukprot:gene14717-16247_t
MIDNTAAVGIVNNMGTCHNPQCNDITLKIWDFFIQHSIWLTAAHLPGSVNVVADRESRNFHSQHTEWMLNTTILEDALTQLKFKPEMDLFASRLNKQFHYYCSFRPDPEALFIDAFSISWSNVKFYCFPPFSCILKTIQKIKRDHAEGIVVVPDWSTQSWRRLIGQNIAPNVIEIILSSWRSATQNQYSSSIRKWFEFCTDRSINIVAPTIPQVLSFLTMIHEDGLSYSSVNTAKSALSSVLDLGTEIPLGQLPLIKRFMKGVFERRPSFPKHKTIWDVTTVLDFFRQQGPNEFSSIAQDAIVTKKFVEVALKGLQQPPQDQSSDSKCTDLKRRNIWKKEKCPDWWPENIPFRSPNARPSLSVDSLDSILSSFKVFIIAVGVNEVESDEMSDSPRDEQVDNTIGSSGWQDAYPAELVISDNVEL